MVKAKVMYWSDGTAKGEDSIVILSIWPSGEYLTVSKSGEESDMKYHSNHIYIAFPKGTILSLLLQAWTEPLKRRLSIIKKVWSSFKGLF